MFSTITYLLCIAFWQISWPSLVGPLIHPTAIVCRGPTDAASKYCMERTLISRWSCSTAGGVLTSGYFYVSSGRLTPTRSSWVVCRRPTVSRSALSGYVPCLRASRTTMRWARYLATPETRVDSLQQRSSVATLQLRYPSKSAQIITLKHQLNSLGIGSWFSHGPLRYH